MSGVLLLRKAFLSLSAYRLDCCFTNLGSSESSAQNNFFWENKGVGPYANPGCPKPWRFLFSVLKNKVEPAQGKANGLAWARIFTVYTELRHGHKTHNDIEKLGQSRAVARSGRPQSD